MSRFSKPAPASEAAGEEAGGFLSETVGYGEEQVRHGELQVETVSVPAVLFRLVLRRLGCPPGLCTSVVYVFVYAFEHGVVGSIFERLTSGSVYCHG